MEKLKSLSDQILAWLMHYGPKVLAALVVLIGGLYVVNWLSRLISRSLNRGSVDSSLRSFLASIVGAALKVLLIITVAEMLGIQTTSFVAVVGALGLAIGLALQGSLANLAGGVLLLVFKPFKVGDVIESGGQTGTVQGIQIFNTILLTPEHKTIFLANGAVSNNTIINHTKHGTRRVDIVMPIASSNSIEKARAVVLEVMKANEKVLAEPAPTVNVLKVGDGIVTLAIRPFANNVNYWDVFFGVQEQVKNAFDANNIDISGPAVAAKT